MANGRPLYRHVASLVERLATSTCGECGYGAVGAGRDDNPGKLSAGCQFYIVANRNGLKRLDGNYTVYGQVIEGMDVVEAIVAVPTDSSDQPLKPIPLRIDVIQLSKQDLEKYGLTPR